MFGLNQVNAEEVFIDKAVAIANDEIILKSELDNATNRYIESLKAKGVEIPNLQDVRKNILEQLIINSLIMQLAKKNSFDLSDTDVDRAIEYMARSNNMTPKQLIEEAKKNGFSEALFRAKMKEDVITNELKRSQVRSRINISDQEAEQLAINLKEHAETQESYHLANILIRIPQDATP
ncbi:MAG: SurA N-terminal domain-containing protein, partial [Succinivibrionaceae bacterium]|nr:SurA N-terminal domain-containing protein [Succinivibrionaceae bacterium]